MLGSTNKQELKTLYSTKRTGNKDVTFDKIKGKQMHYIYQNERKIDALHLAKTKGKKTIHSTKRKGNREVNFNKTNGINKQPIQEIEALHFTKTTEK